MPVYQLFPEPVYFSKLERKLTKNELSIIHTFKIHTSAVETRQSVDDYVLEKKELNNLKKDLNKKVIDYFDKVVCTNNSIIPYITQSWLNYTKLNEYHHKHLHPNSYVSGVFYINTDKEVDKIKFFKERYERIELECKEFNKFNATSWDFPVETGDVVLFPSSLYHGVDVKKGINTRISLSFNVFFKGKIGTQAGLTELVLE